MTNADHAGGILTIDLDAIAGNYRLLNGKCAASGAKCAAVIKADAYGLGAAVVGPALESAGCRVFFVALTGEGVSLRGVLPKAEIHVLAGPLAGNEDTFEEYGLVPTLNSLGDVDTWAAFCRRQDHRLPANLQIDTGMSRLGLPPGELDVLADDPSRLDGLAVANMISHLACADEPGHSLNRRQLESFTRARTRIAAGAKASLANSSGIFLGPEYHFDLARPGAALYGVGPVPGIPNPMAQVVHLQGRILQVRDVDSPQTVGYGAIHRFAQPTRIATVAVGYADGYLRSFSDSGCVYVGDIRAPVVGRVSMDLITVDVSGAPESGTRPGTLVDVIGPHNPIDTIAKEGGTIGYEILTSLGHRYHRVYSSSQAGRA